MTSFTQAAGVEDSESACDMFCSTCKDQNKEVDIYCTACQLLYCIKCIELHGVNFETHSAYWLRKINAGKIPRRWKIFFICVGCTRTHKWKCFAKTTLSCAAPCATET
ncbi:hypothetical protein DPMN_013463 [Dreissena polymorpha]|uniref:B box-type domain-containing protein n=1 Tax=Dreissena polymorpha TaxID=45954 RepID=A0A9D4S1V8_DREPO|nr:hypothetical protein DPMN_013463 [Dreissena polymorpha]